MSHPRFFYYKGMLLNEKNVLRHKDLHISGLLNVKKADIHAEKVDIEGMLSEKTIMPARLAPR